MHRCSVYLSDLIHHGSLKQEFPPNRSLPLSKQLLVKLIGGAQTMPYSQEPRLLTHPPPPEGSAFRENTLPQVAALNCSGQRGREKDLVASVPLLTLHPLPPPFPPYNCDMLAPPKLNMETRVTHQLGNSCISSGKARGEGGAEAGGMLRIPTCASSRVGKMTMGPTQWAAPRPSSLPAWHSSPLALGDSAPLLEDQEA